MTESIHHPTSEDGQRAKGGSRTLECPSCFHRFEVHEFLPSRPPQSQTYIELAAQGLTARKLAEDTGLTRQRITSALSGERPFPPQLWTELAHQFGAERANQIRHIAFLDRRRRRDQSLDRPTEPPLAVLWDVGLSPQQLAWHAAIGPKRASEEILGQRSFSIELNETILRLAGRRVLEKLREA